MTYRELYMQERTWIASHVAGDMLHMNQPTDEVTEHDMARIIDARKRDAAVATLPKERNDVFATATARKPLRQRWF